MSKRRAFVVVAATVLGMGAVFGAAPSVAQPAAAAPKPAGAFRLYQLNMCMWGAQYYVANNANGGSTCFPDEHISKDASGKLHFGDGWEAREKEIGAKKRQALLDQVKTYQPDAMTVNEACEADVDAVRGLGYTVQTVDLGQGRTCSAGRGTAVNAVIAKGFDTASRPEGGYFQAKGARAWMCSYVTAGHVRVCTAHLSLPSQGPQPAECNILRSKVRKTGGRPTVFAGDTNINWKQNKNNCEPGDSWGLQDIETDAARKNSQSGMQQIYYTTNLSRQSTCGEMHSIPWPAGSKPDKAPPYATDHKGYLYRVGTPTRGAACTWRDLRPSGWAPTQKWLHGYVFHQEDHAGWTGPAAARLALTMQAQVPYQSTLNSELGSAPSPATMTNVLNEHLAADGASRFYRTRNGATLSGLRSDMRYDFIRGTAIVARIQGSARDTQNHIHTAKSPSYLTVVGYYQGGARLTVENIAASRTGMKARRYNLTVEQFQQWVAGGYSA
jgi:hypothetical protein